MFCALNAKLAIQFIILLAIIAAKGENIFKEDDGTDAGKAAQRFFKFIAGFLPKRSHKSFFVENFIPVLAQLSKADGIITKSEIAAVRDWMDIDFGLNAGQKKRAVELFRNEKDKSSQHIRFAGLIKKRFRKDPRKMYTVLKQMVNIAQADGVISPKEFKILSEVAAVFEIDHSRLERMLKGRFTEQYAKRPAKEYDMRMLQSYKALGCQPGESLSFVKKRYRELVKKYHPDKQRQGSWRSKLKFQEVQEAYDYIIKKSR